jgi:hypothetical protein
MKVRMVQERTGPRWDGQAWPPPQGVLEVDDGEAEALIAHGWAEPADAAPPPPPAEADSPEPAPEPAEPPAAPRKSLKELLEDPPPAS